MHAGCLARGGRPERSSGAGLYRRVEKEAIQEWDGTSTQVSELDRESFHVFVRLLICVFFTTDVFF